MQSALQYLCWKVQGCTIDYDNGMVEYSVRESPVMFHHQLTN